MPKSTALVVAAIVLVAAVGDGVVAGREVAAPGVAAPLVVQPIVTAALPHVRSAPLAELPFIAPGSPKGTSSAPDVAMPIELGDRVFSDPALQPPGAGGGLASAPPTSAGFDGIGQSGTGAPPDPVGDVGPRHYVQAVNGALAVFTKRGRRVYGPAAPASLWKGVDSPCRRYGRGDPIVQYDALARRWLVSEFAFKVDSRRRPRGPFYQCIAVSRGRNPLGRYELYPFLVSRNRLPDYPKFGVWTDAYYMTVHLFDVSSGEYRGQGIYAFDRPRMLAGAAAYAPVGVSDPDFYGALPADVDGEPPPRGAPGYLLSVRDSSGGLVSDRLELFEFHIEWGSPAATTLTPSAVIFTEPFDTDLCYGNINCIPQRGTTRRLDPMAGGVLMYRLAYRNFGTHESLVLNHVVDVDGSDHAGIRWYEVRDPSSRPYLQQQGTYAPDGSHRWVASIAMDVSGNIAMGYSVSGPRMFPSVRYTGRLSGDQPGRMAAERNLVVGRGAQTGSSRWGDYSSLSVDPRDGCTFWYTQEYYKRTSPDDWSTRVGSFRFEPCGPMYSPDPAPAPEPTVTPGPPSQEPGDDGDTTSPRITGVADFPDPFTPNRDGRRDATEIRFDLSEEAHVTVVVRSTEGRLVRRLADARLTPGPWFAKWAGNNVRRRPARAGTYTYFIRAVDAAGNVRVVKGTTRLVR